MLQLGPFEGAAQPVPLESIERLRECAWRPSATVPIPEAWPSGVYLVKLTLCTAPHYQSYIIFVVKTRENSDVLVQVSDLTWQAYNRWPGTNSLYDDGSPELWYQGTNVRVSFDRPYAKYCQIVDQPLSSGSGEFLLWEYPLTYWLEAEGYEVAYCSNLDLHHDPEVLSRGKVFLSVGHDEYWTREMYRNLESARDNGLSLLFLSGNSLFHEIETYGEDKGAATFRSFARKQRMHDAAELMGASSYGPGYGDWTVINPDHWVYNGTGLQAGDKLPGLLGWEYHGAPFKDVPGLTLLAHSELFGNEAEPANFMWEESDGRHAAIIYPGGHGNWVFNAGTIWWAEGLSSPPGHIPAVGIGGRPQGTDPRVQRMTRNLLDRCIGIG